MCNIRQMFSTDKFQGVRTFIGILEDIFRITSVCYNLNFNITVAFYLYAKSTGLFKLKFIPQLSPA